MNHKKDYTSLPKKSNKSQKADKDQRICRLVRLMVMLDTGILNLDNAAKECGVNKRTIQRDLKVLEAAGLPIYKPKESNANYRLEKDFHLLRYHITSENIDHFRHTIEALTRFNKEPVDILNPIQKEMFDFAQKKEEEFKRRQEYANKEFHIGTSREQLNSLLLQGKTDKEHPYSRLQTLFLAEDMFNKIDADRSYAYKHIQTEEIYRIYAHWARVLRNYPKAIESLQELIKKEPKTDWPYIELAFVYYEKGQIDNAIEIAQKGLEKAEEKEDLRVYLSFFLSEAKQYDAAIDCFKKLKYYPQENLAFSCEVHKKEGKLELALLEIEKALELCPQNGMYKVQRGLVLMELAKQGKIKA